MEHKRLYIDGLNLFQAYSQKRWKLQNAFQAVRKFMRTAHDGGYEVLVFIDASTGDANSEASQKWIKRREKDVRKEKRDVPQGSNVLVGDMFRVCGAAVHYSFVAANDDTLAAFAWLDGAYILSKDGDFLRYHCGEEQCFKGRVFCSFACTPKGLKLTPLEFGEISSKIEVLHTRPTTVDVEPCLVNLRDLMYLRGAPSSCVKQLGNIHGYEPVVQLRRALLAHKQVTDLVNVQFPEWEAERVVWKKWQEEPRKATELFQHTKREELFRECVDLVKARDPALIDANQLINHLFACRAVVCELWLLGQTPPRGKSDFLFMMMAFEKWVDDLLRTNAKLNGVALCNDIGNFYLEELNGRIETVVGGKPFGFINAGGRRIFFHFSEVLFPESLLRKGLTVKFFACMLPSNKWSAFAVSRDGI